MEPLSTKTVDMIHTRLLVRYGARWMSMWAGLDVALVKADWAEQLAGMSWAQIDYALCSLPANDNPPNAAQFRAICYGWRNPKPQPALPAPASNPARVAAELAKMAEIRRAREASPKGRLQWAYDLQERSSRGESLSPAANRAWREALASPAVVLNRPHDPPDPRTYPPAMRAEWESAQRSGR